MPKSLQEQLLKAGLATEKQLEDAERRQSRPVRPRIAPNDARGDRGKGRDSKAPRPKGDRDDKARGRGKPRRDANKGGPRRDAKPGEGRPRGADGAGASPGSKRAVPKDKRRLRQRVRALLEERALTAPGGETPYNFVRGKRVKRLYIDDAMRARLLGGELVVAEVYGLHHVLDHETLRELLGLLPETFVHRHGDEAKEAPADAAATPGGDDYAGYEVPDDLVW